MCVHGVDRDRLRLGALVNHIAGGWFDLFGNDSARHAGNPNFTFVIAREIKTVEGFVLDGTPQDILIKGGEVQQLTGDLVSDTMMVLPGSSPETITVPSVPVL